MAQGANPFYYQADSQLAPAIGATLGRALFGDPGAAAKLALQRAQMANYAATTGEANAHTGLYGAQQADAEQKTAGSRKLSDAIAALQASQAQPAAVAPTDPLAPLPAAPSVTDQFKTSLPGIVSNLVLAQGDKADASTLAQIPAYLGGNDERRAALIAQGKPTDENFAGTDQRADQILGEKAGAELNKATTVANIDNGGRLAVAGIESGDRRYSTNVESSDRRRGQDLEHGDRLYGDNLTHGQQTYGGWTPRFSAGGDNSDQAVDGKELAMAQRLGIPTNAPIPRGQLGAVFDAIAATEGPQPNNNPGNIVDGPFARSQPGYVGAHNGFAVFANPEAGRQAGISLLNGKYARGQNTIASIVEGLPVPAKEGAKTAPKMISSAESALLDTELTAQLKANGFSASGAALQNMRISAQRNLQGGLPPAQAVSNVINAYKNNAAHASAPAPSNLDGERQRALTAIQNGAPRAQVAQLFKQRTGQSL